LIIKIAEKMKKKLVEAIEWKQPFLSLERLIHLPKCQLLVRNNHVTDDL
jgi:hypothetical protein